MHTHPNPDLSPFLQSSGLHEVSWLLLLRTEKMIKVLASQTSSNMANTVSPGLHIYNLHKRLSNLIKFEKKLYLKT